MYQIEMAASAPNETIVKSKSNGGDMCFRCEMNATNCPPPAFVAFLFLARFLCSLGQ